MGQLIPLVVELCVDCGVKLFHLFCSKGKKLFYFPSWYDWLVFVKGGCAAMHEDLGSLKVELFLVLIHFNFLL
jgi:hypothetical protein